LRVVETLAEATAALQEIVRPGDVVLFENDLPDLYLDGQA
jgi:UDP-N-acetylmuramoyl-tripeptide--D-alanyl-D-alanine ligase